MVGSNMGRICTLTVVYNLNFRHTGRNIIGAGNNSNIDFINPQAISLVNIDQRFVTMDIVSGSQDPQSSWLAPGEPGVVSRHEDTSREELPTHYPSRPDLNSREQ